MLANKHIKHITRIEIIGGLAGFVNFDESDSLAAGSSEVPLTLSKLTIKDE
jgi:hypothetical protein